MTVDYLSTLNSQGSGLNVTQLVTSIVDAEIEPAKALINEKSNANELSVSEIALLRSRMDGAQGIFEDAGNGSLYRVQSSASEIDVSVSDEHLLTETRTQIAVSQLAAPQVLEFTDFSGTDDTLGAGDLIVHVGTWASGTFTADADLSAQIITLDADTTLSDLTGKLNALNGVYAQVVDKGDGTFSLSLLSETGASNALRITASNTALSALDTTNGSNEVSAAQNAQLQVNGISVQRATNVLTDVIPGAEITLRGTMSVSQSVNVQKDVDDAKASLDALLSQINALRSYIDTTTRRGVNGSEPGPLAGDPTIEAIKRDLMNLTTAPLSGFGDDPVYLSDVGVQTELDGTLSLDAEQLRDVLDTQPEKFQALFSSSGSIDLANMSVALTPGTFPKAGAFDFAYDADSQIATLDGEALFRRTNTEGQREFYRDTGDFSGVTLRVLDGVATDGTVNLGLSFVDKIESYLTELLDSRGEVATKEAAYAERASGFRTQLAELDDRALMLEQREMVKFAKMEQAVTQLKSTGEYITSMMDAWAKDS